MSFPHIQKIESFILKNCPEIKAVTGEITYNPEIFDTVINFTINDSSNKIKFKSSTFQHVYDMSKYIKSVNAYETCANLVIEEWKNENK